MHPTLSFAPLAFLKLQFCCHAGDTEVGGFGISSAEDPLHIVDFMTVRQRTTAVTVQFEDDAIADFFDACADKGIKPAQCGRAWIHTHPGSSAKPSMTDEDTFARRFGSCSWSVMAIVARSGDTYARLALNSSPGAQVELPVTVRWQAWPEALAKSEALDALVSAWKQEFETNVRPALPSLPVMVASPTSAAASPGEWWDTEPWDEMLDGFYYEPLYLENFYDPVAGPPRS